MDTNNEWVSLNDFWAAFMTKQFGPGWEQRLPRTHLMLFYSIFVAGAAGTLATVTQRQDENLRDDLGRVASEVNLMNDELAVALHTTLHGITEVN